MAPEVMPGAASATARAALGRIYRAPLRRLGAPRLRGSAVRFDAEQELEDFHPHPHGHSLVATAHGKLLELVGLWEGPVFQRGATEEVRYSGGCYLHSGRIAAASCENGEWRLRLFDGGGGGGGGGVGGGAGCAVTCATDRRISRRAMGTLPEPGGRPARSVHARPPTAHCRLHSRRPCRGGRVELRRRDL